MATMHVLTNEEQKDKMVEMLRKLTVDVLEGRAVVTKLNYSMPPPTYGVRDLYSMSNRITTPGPSILIYELEIEVHE